MLPLKDSFKFLNAEDITLLEKNIEVFDIEAGTVLIKEDEQKKALFILLDGFLKIEKLYLDTPVPFARLTPGAIFGEMSLLENRGASGTVVCKTQCKIAILDAKVLQKLLDADPSFAARFYQSLAYLLSTRLREANLNMIPGTFSMG